MKLPTAARPLITAALTLLFSACVLTRSAPDDGSGVASSSRSPKTALQNALGVFDGTSRVKPAAALLALRAQHESATGNEHELIKDLIPILERAVGGPQGIKRADYAVVKKAFEKMSTLYPDDFDVQLQSAAGSYALTSVALGSPEEATNADAQKRALALVTRFPAQARAHAHRGQVLERTGGDTLDAMRAYIQCNELDVKRTLCKRELTALTAEYTRSKCKRFNTKSFAMHPAYEQFRRGLKRVVVGDQQLFMESKAAFTGADVSDVQETSGNAGKEGVYRLWFTPGGAGRFAKVTEKLAAEQAYLVVLVGGRVVQAPRVMSTIESGEVQILAPRSKMDGLCREAERKKLPADIARAVK